MSSINPAAPPSVRRTTPAPYRRPCIDIGGSQDELRGPRRWSSVAIRDLRPGDILPGVGLIASVTEHVSAPPAGSGLSVPDLTEQVVWTVTVRGGEGNERTTHGSQRAWAFTAAHARDSI